jgi:hypothetical protein
MICEHFYLYNEVYLILSIVLCLGINRVWLGDTIGKYSTVFYIKLIDSIFTKAYYYFECDLK